MLTRVFNPKPEYDLGEKSRLSRGVKEQLVKARLKDMIVREQVANSPVDIGASPTKWHPATGWIPILQCHRNAGGGPAGGRIEDMRGDRAHALSSFLNLNRAIRCCSWAAFRISLSASFSMRRRRISSISFAVLPVAQTMKV